MRMFSGILMKKLGRDPRNDLPRASGSMVADVLTLLTVIIAGDHHRQRYAAGTESAR